MHAVRHRYSLDQVQAIARALDRAGVDAIEVAHGDGLSGSSFNYGFRAHTDWEWLEAATDVLQQSKLTTLLWPGIGTIHDLTRAAALSVTSDRVATHCTDTYNTRHHTQQTPGRGLYVAGFPNMSHIINPTT